LAGGLDRLVADDLLGGFGVPCVEVTPPPVSATIGLEKAREIEGRMSLRSSVGAHREIEARCGWKDQYVEATDIAPV
jgi:hypothetical protein